MGYKLLVINWQDITHPLGGGAEVHLHQIFRRLVKRGHSVTLLCCTYPGAKPEEVLDGIHIIRRGSRSFFNFIVPFMYRKLCQQHQFDIVFDDINKIPFYTPLYVRKPLVAIVHHFFGYRIFQETNLAVAYYVFLCERIVPLIYRNVPFIAVSPSSTNELEAMGIERNRIEIVHNGVDCRHYQPGLHPKSDVPLIGYVGRIKRYKSVEHIILAMEKVVQAIPAAELVIVGDGDNLDALKRITAEQHLTGKVHFTGAVSEEDKIRYFNKMWVSVNPSPKEGWGIVVIEANACGTPVIAADSPGLRDSVSDGVSGYLYPYGNIEKLSEKLIRLLNDRSERERLSRQAVKWSQQFDWNVSAEKTERLIENNLFDSREALHVS
ncbi:glycosyltransferase family 4 protein [candidate division KSB1 bacterium]|nr:glycosyltransferase family 4 protein [candidate division KSB1 bacterium]